MPDSPFGAAQAQALLARARGVQAQALEGALPPLLQGKNVALTTTCGCCDDGAAQEALLRRASTELGAHVSTITLALDEHSSDAQVASTARLLSQLYSVVECSGLPVALVQRLAQAASIPIVAGLASTAHPTAGLSAQLPGDAPMADKRRWMLQACLLAAMD